ncbi:MAG: aminotransferase class I/II-fold pyridoxal phosphate-dependent enzyme [Bacteriovoracaceae bacterium]|jgi:aspartate/methionine/tyrosine aminotransferase|nr:aminotransferase class I/II-fold pyridoxal phosphate-dependent enzyme [Bacteriovoracaceae bacterium]
MKNVNHVITTFKESIFATLTNLAREHNAINLSQGFPDFDGPDWVIQNAKDAIAQGAQGSNQYAPLQGILSLRQVLSKIYKRHYDLNYCEHTEVTITNGATEAIFSSILALINPGDEVIIFEPFYDSYVASIKLAGGIPVPVTLHGPRFNYQTDKLSEAFNDKTKLIILNSPHNPTGKVFNTSELEEISKLCISHDTFCLSDEVYEFLTFNSNVHQPMATFPKMKERTITISSTGKTFGVTGWKIGWTMASPEITYAIRMVHQFNTFCVNHPLQIAIAKSLQELDEYLILFKKSYTKKRDLFFSGLEELGYLPIKPQGTYFIMCPIANKTKLKDVDYCMELIKKKGVATIPPSSFYMLSNDGENYLRFCFAKKDETLKTALLKLK